LTRYIDICKLIRQVAPPAVGLAAKLKHLDLWPHYLELWPCNI